MKRAPSFRIALFVAAAAALLVGWTEADEYISGKVWTRPEVIDPGPPGGPPSDAIVLFGGENLDAWEGGQHWKVEDGVATVSGLGGVRTKEGFGDCQLHLEWAAPEKVTGSGQGRGNSGVYLMGKYEVQILDSFDNETYYDGQCGAVYKQQPPLVNACRKPGEWQTYDIIFRAPRFDESGAVTQPAAVTVLQNGVLVQNHFELEGGTYWDQAPEYTAHEPELPLHLQNHGNPMRFRNIWIRRL